ncbi:MULTISPECIES: type I-E CRISPR-associated protein Cse2/CasB [Aeromonas]|uniref:type I-E CRISPR-associated protein Cse2/CasB n=1 Tax=Aeromonas TaxID=642 RepID=UPI0022DF38F7|nr:MULTISPECIES: type I-E CRISPR-associated protein Cse2/CasB [Aeromonas]
MSNANQNFIKHLTKMMGLDLPENQRQGHHKIAQAELKRSLGFGPGYYKVAKYVDPFVLANELAEDARCRALYLVAGLLALSPKLESISLATAMGRLALKLKPSNSIENRFVALIERNGESIDDPLRQVITLLKAHDFGFDYVLLLNDLTTWLNQSPKSVDQLDRLRRRWASDFYRAATPTSND